LAQIRFASALARSGADVTLLVGCVNAGFQMPDVPGVKLEVLGKERVVRMLVPLVRYLIKNRPEVIFSAEDHLNSIVLFAAMLSGSKARISGSSRVTPFDTYSNVMFSKRWILKQFARFTMPRAHALTCVSQDMVKQYESIFPDCRHVCVYNIVDDGTAPDKICEPVDEDWFDDRSTPVFIGAGQFGPWKGFDVLIRAFKEVLKSRAARLIILGDGAQRADLERLVRDLGLEDAVKLPGYRANPLKYFARSDVFVLSSHVEGLPNVLVEAMMCGCTPVSTDCPTGPREVLMDGKYGYLSPPGNPQKLAEAMLEALDNPIPKALLHKAVEPFAERVILERHFELLGLNGFGPKGTVALA
jgi:glycosyltransferase involved in cell wall biosynthesis